YRMGVNSDDGFVLSTGPGGPGPFGLVLGSFNGGRGASDSVFDFAVEAAGDYPFRLLWWEGGGGANVEWFAVNIDTGEKILVNHTNPNSVKAFRTGAGRAYVKSLLPANGYTGVNPNVTVRAELVDGATTVVDGSVSLVIDGNPVTATIVNGATTTVTWTPAAGLPVDSTHTGRLIWTESTTPATVWTNNFTFTIRRMVPDDLPAQGAFWIEAEDWDHSSGQSVASASTMPYLGGAYDGLAGVLNVDYFDDQNDGDAGIDFTYRTDKRPNHVNITVNTANRFAVDRPGPVDLTIDYRIGWVGNTWCNYTRQVPAGVYKAYAALSIDNSNVDAMQADLDRVTAGVGTTSQTLERLGTFFGRGNGAWGSSEMAVLRDSLGNDAIFNVEGANTTFRVTARSGDFAWFVLIPTTSPAKLRTGPPQGTAPFSIPHTLKWVLDDFSTTINTATASLKIDGATVTAPAFTVTKTGKVTTATYVADIGNPHTYEFSINDSAGATIATTGVFIGNFMTPSPTGMFLIETEDFNTAGGQVQAAVNTMPYLGNAYNGLSATANIDYARTADEPSGNVYRLTEVPNVPFSGDGDMVRARDAAGAATWTLTANYRLGWAGAGNWYNFTRQIPAGSYQVWASMSYGDATDADVQLVGNLSRVTSDPTQGSQTIESIGYFRGPATGGWGANQLVPLRASDTDISGPAAVVTLGGPTATTLRFEDASGDLDYFMLVPSAPGLRFNPPGLSGGQMTISWTGTGTLQQTDSLSPPNWGPAPSQANPQTVTASDASKYYRLQQ
ncbi:MAG TPA: hypothetical protein VJW76_15255, partial [Verrucomicrobiae bacterium]|nr:hypothetical protein [Verrucomicrobiae bacterium]